MSDGTHSNTPVAERDSSEAAIKRVFGWDVGQWPVAALVFALAGIAGLTLDRPNIDQEVLGLIAMTILFGAGVLGVAWHGRTLDALRTAAMIGVPAALIFQAVPDFIILQVQVFVVTIATALLLVAVALMRRLVPSLWVTVLSLLAIVVVAASCVSVLGGEAPGIDVVALHEQAVDALWEGENPYTTGNVSVAESKPVGENELIEEYTYPPINLAWYALGRAINGDVRTGGAVALVLSLGLFVIAGVPATRSAQGMVHSAMLAVLGLLIVNQAMYLMVSNGWTELVALPFFFASILWWRRMPVASAIALGLALASKQYFIIALPVLAFVVDPFRYKRIAIAVASAAATMVPFLIWDARGLIDGLVTHHLTRDARPDGLTIANLGVEVPTVVAVAVAVGFGVWVVRRATTVGGVWLATGGVFAIFTLLAVRGFLNSWWLVYCLAALGLLVAAERLVGGGATESAGSGIDVVDSPEHGAPR